MDVICQAKSGMGKTAVFVLAVLQQLEPVPGRDRRAHPVPHARARVPDLHEFERFSVYLPNVNVSVVFGGVNIKQQKEELEAKPPSVVVATPGRLKALAKDGSLSLKQCGHFILDECDKMLEQLDMRADVQEIFKMTPHDKQVMMFTATLSQGDPPVCKKFMNDPMEIYVDDETKAHAARSRAALHQAPGGRRRTVS